MLVASLVGLERMLTLVKNSLLGNPPATFQLLDKICNWCSLDYVDHKVVFLEGVSQSTNIGGTQERK